MLVTRRIPSSEWLVIAILLLFTTGLRFVGINWGEPHLYTDIYSKQMIPLETPLHPDEFLFVAKPLEMVVKGRFNPKFFHNPSFLINLNLVTFWITGADKNIAIADREGLSIRQYAPFHLYVIGRFYSALGGLLAVAATYAATRGAGGKFAAFVAGLLIAVSLPMVQHSHYATTSSLAAGFTAMAIWASFVALRGNFKFLLIAGIAAGLAAGNRYNAAAVGIVVFM